VKSLHNLSFSASNQALSDEEILQRYRQDHNQEWIGMLFKRYVHLVMGMSLKYLKNIEDARDATQQIFLKVMREIDRTPIHYFKGWLYQVTKNYCLMQLRSKQAKDKLTEPEEEHQPVFLPEDEEHVQMKNIQLELLEEALKQLNTTPANLYSIILSGKTFLSGNCRYDGLYPDAGEKLYSEWKTESAHHVRKETKTVE